MDILDPTACLKMSFYALTRYEGVQHQQCQRCQKFPCCFPSCIFVQPMKMPTGELEQLQCIFIDWALMHELAFVQGDLLTFVEGFDIIPPAMEAAIEEWRRDPTPIAYEALVGRYKAFLSNLRESLIANHLIPRRIAVKKARALKAGRLNARGE